MKREQLNELLLQSLEHEKGGVKVQIVHDACLALEIDPEQETPGRGIVRDMGGALVKAMEKALGAGDKGAAQLVACECVVIAETKDHLDWELIGKCADKLKGEQAKALKDAYEEVEDQEDEHLYHTKGWCRELWIESLGMKAILPPPEERKHVKTAIGAAKAEQASAKSR